jgi:hypothetical protein
VTATDRDLLEPLEWQGLRLVPTELTGWHVTVRGEHNPGHAGPTFEFTAWAAPHQGRWRATVRLEVNGAATGATATVHARAEHGEPLDALDLAWFRVAQAAGALYGAATRARRDSIMGWLRAWLWESAR